MNYAEFVTSIESFDPNKFYIVRIPADSSQQKMLTLQKVLRTAKLQAVIVPDTITFEELTESHLDYLMKKAKIQKPEPSAPLEGGIMTKGA